MNNNRILSCEEANNLDMVDYFSRMGVEPKRISGHQFWYLSPFHDERTTSFKINRSINCWYDFGEGKGGTMVDFGTRYFKCSVYEFMTEMIRLRTELHPVGSNFNQAVKRLHTLEKITEFKSWLLLYETSRKLLLGKIENIKKNWSVLQQMVAIIHNSGNLRNALHYNKHKVSKGVAECIHSVSFPKDTDQLSFKDKFNRFNNFNLFNQQTKINTVHISINFDSSDKLTPEKMQAIAETYMQRISFEDQPYLVYQHNKQMMHFLHSLTINYKE